MRTPFADDSMRKCLTECSELFSPVVRRGEAGLFIQHRSSCFTKEEIHHVKIYTRIFSIYIYL